MGSRQVYRVREAAVTASMGITDWYLAILDAPAHEFKTPLATILAVVDGLRESERLRLLRLAGLDREEVRPRVGVQTFWLWSSALPTATLAGFRNGRLL
jgi:hypothetical protein